MKIALLVLLCVVALYASQSLAARITLGYDPIACAIGDYQETDNMERWLKANGHSVLRMNDYTDNAGWAYALSQSAAVIFPEHAVSNPMPLISNEAFDKIRAYVQSGGLVIVAAGSDNRNVYNTITNLDVAAAGGSLEPFKRGDGPAATYSLTEDAGAFSGPPRVVRIDACSPVDISDVDNANLKCYYGTNTNCAMCRYANATGSVVSVCPDFYNFGPWGTQDGGWERTLAALLPPGSTSAATRLSSWVSLFSL